MTPARLDELDLRVRDWVLSSDLMDVDAEGRIRDDTGAYLALDDVMEEYRHAYTIRIERAIDQVLGWDREYVDELRGRLNYLYAKIETAYEAGAIDENDRDYYRHRIDLSELPTVPIPDDVDTTFPVWCMDLHGGCLVGETLQGVRSLDEVRQIQNERRSAQA